MTVPRPFPEVGHSPMSDIVRVPFHGDDVLTVDVNGEPNVILKPALESIGLDYWAQIRKLRDRSWATTASKAVVAGDGKVREMVTCNVQTFLMLLATVEESRVGEDVRPKLVTYQREVAKVIEAYWTKGGAINPRATREQLQDIAATAEAQARVLQALTGIVDPHWLEAKARHVAARALGEEPEIERQNRPLTVGEYLEEQGVTGATLRSISTGFGKKLKALYRERIDSKGPMTTDRFVDGALRKVAVYTESHRPLFDEVWASPYGAAAI